MKYPQRTVRMVSALLSAVSLLGSAQALTVQELGVSPGETASISVAGFYTGDVSVGILKLVVDGVAADGFCIDPYHFSLSSSSEYQFRSLADAPKLPGTMGAIKAEAVSKLWAMAYSPNMTSEEAAALQLAIWETIAGDNFSVLGNDYGASFLLQRLESYSGNGANLIALSGPGQDYVTPVPDGGSTLIFLALAAAGLVCVQLFARSLSFSAASELRG
ncbi:MAG: hypothetical protein H0W34_15125 [Pyrinomonadaceae bacterium]|nr:hypothetical protein [Pyrinomonadaceae bacterium]